MGNQISGALVLRTVMWGTPVGAETWKEKVITEQWPDSPELDKARAWAESHGFDRIRTTTMPLPAPVQ